MAAKTDTAYKNQAIFSDNEWFGASEIAGWGGGGWRTEGDHDHVVIIM